jgi:hypothetical protein
MLFRTLLMTIILASICFGGTFTCKNHDDDHTVVVHGTN